MYIKGLPGCDDEIIQEKYYNSLKEDQERNYPIIKEFKNLLSHLYMGSIRSDNEGLIWIDPKIHTEEKTKIELADLFHEYMEEKPNEKGYREPNTRSILYTQETQKELKKTLDKCGLELIEKYIFRTISIENEERIEVIRNASIKDIGKISKILEHVQYPDDELVEKMWDIIYICINKINEIAEGNFTEENMYIAKNFGGFYNQIERLGFFHEESKDTDEDINREKKMVRDLFIAVKEGCLEKFKKCIREGFITELGNESNNAYIPSFLLDIVENNEKNEQISKEEFDSAYENIKSKFPLFKEIRENIILRETILQEISIGIYYIQNIVKKREGKKETYKKFANLLKEIKNILG